MFTFAIFSNGREGDNTDAGTYATEAEAQAAGEAALDLCCPAGSPNRRYCRVEVRRATPLVRAEWDGEQYVAGENAAWRSGDGDTWVDGGGLPIVDEAFVASTIILCGGPRDGEVVA